MRTIFINFQNGKIICFETSIFDADEPLSVVVVGITDQRVISSIQKRIIDVQAILSDMPDKDVVSLSLCAAIARDELEEFYVNGLAGKGKGKR